MSLYELTKKYGTNKIWHGYDSFYSKLFDNIKDNVEHFLEIGIDQGASLLAWRDYFSNATIFDIVIPSAVQNVERIKYDVADQSNISNLVNTMNKWGNPQFDIILDDGGHTVKQQRTSIETLWKFVKPGGYYIIEDLHTNIRKLHFIHPHLNEYSQHIDELPTVHDKILNIMAGSQNEFAFPFSEIGEIYYFNTPGKMSLSCAFKKV